MGQWLRVLPYLAPNVGDNVLAHGQREIVQGAERPRRGFHCTVNVGEEVVTVTDWCCRRGPVPPNARPRTAPGPWRTLGVAELVVHAVDDRLNLLEIHGHPSLALSYVTAPSTSTVSTIAMMTPSTGRLSVILV